MKGIVQDRYGSADVLQLRDLADPVFGEDEVLVRVRAAGCGPDVWHLMTGLPYFVRLMPAFHKMRAGVRGRDVSGIVEAIGPNATGLSVGDEVMGIVEGSFAELAVGRPDKLVRKPTRLSFEQAAAVPISGLTALRAIRDVAKVQPGQKVLVLGAGGGVGTLAVQIARAFGAEVTGVCSGSKADLVRSLGAHDVIDYREPRGWKASVGRDRRHRRKATRPCAQASAHAEQHPRDRRWGRRRQGDGWFLPPDAPRARAITAHPPAAPPGDGEGDTGGPPDPR
jgi:NADPH:quinone reductase-like Zn-dependent oxidoreductase